MRDGRGKSDSPRVSGKPPNKAEEPAAEAAERRGLAKGNSLQRNTPRTQRRAGVPSALERVRQVARRDRRQRFTALLHQVYALERLRAAYEALNPRALAGIDGETWKHYGQHLEANLHDRSRRLQRGAYRAQPVRRAYIPKTDGRQRPLGVPALEAKRVQRRRQTQATGDLIVVRFADDFVVGCQYRHEAERFLAELRSRFAKVGLALHPDKTRLIEFGPFADRNRRGRGQGKPETFHHRGFTPIGGKKRRGMFTGLRQTIRQRLQAKLQAVKTERRRRMHCPIPEQGAYVRSVVRGPVRYYGVPMNGRAISLFRWAVGRLGHRVLLRRSQTHCLQWRRRKHYITRWLPPARICHPYPLVRLGLITQGKSRMR